MSEAVIRARDLRKVYRLYSGAGYRFLDMFGMLGQRPGVFAEHAALDGVSLDVQRGEKVAFIGRNGAGKSTLLKLITKVIEPTSGSLEVSGKVHALLQIGTGFHPDFTGLQNVYAYLAQLGVTGRDAEARCKEIVDFAELEEYIGQPVKTYSTGMAVRLMFSTATAITPELLVLDEVLGVGDAYFAQKSYERMRHLTDSAGTTLLLVTHDIYSAVKLCDRLVWIDKGRILMDGDGPTVIKAYEDSIRQQEEARLRLRKQHRLQEAVEQHAAPRVILELQGTGNRPPDAPVYFSRIAIVGGNEPIDLPLGANAFDESLPGHLEREGSAWSEAQVRQGRPSRGLLNYGSPFHKVAGVLPLRENSVSNGRLEIDYYSERAFTLAVRLFGGNDSTDLGTLAGVAGEWTQWSADLRGRSSSGTGGREINSSGVHGTGAVTVTDIATFNAAGDETHFFAHGDPFELRLSYRINQPDLLERPQVLIALHRDGVQDVCRVITRDLLFDASQSRSGEVKVRIPELRLGVGNYTVTVMIARERYYDEEQTRYFSLNPGVYACHSRALEISVTSDSAIASGTVVVADAEWSLRT